MTDPFATHLASWLGAWPPPGPGVHVVAAERRTAPTWDGAVRPVMGAVRPAGDGTDAAALVVTAPALHAAVAALLDGRPTDDLGDRELGARVGEVVAGPGAVLGRGVLRWATADEDDLVGVDEVADLGVWLPWDDRRVPPWLHPFGHEVLVALDDEGRYAAGVGVKHHDEHGRELAVVTTEAHRGKGWARRLVATAARHELARAPVVTYLHARDNAASAHVAEAVGFTDRGWDVLGVFGGAAAG
jgi:GNAT superfamily N-acetyltransferase